MRLRLTWTPDLWRSPSEAELIAQLPALGGVTAPSAGDEVDWLAQLPSLAALVASRP